MKSTFKIASQLLKGVKTKTCSPQQFKLTIRLLPKVEISFVRQLTKQLKTRGPSGQSFLKLMVQQIIKISQQKQLDESVIVHLISLNLSEQVSDQMFNLLIQRLPQPPFVSSYVEIIMPLYQNKYESKAALSFFYSFEVNLAAALPKQFRIIQRLCEVIVLFGRNPTKQLTQALSQLDFKRVKSSEQLLLFFTKFKLDDPAISLSKVNLQKHTLKLDKSGDSQHLKLLQHLLKCKQFSINQQGLNFDNIDDKILNWKQQPLCQQINYSQLSKQEILKCYQLSQTLKIGIPNGQDMLKVILSRQDQFSDRQFLFLLRQSLFGNKTKLDFSSDLVRNRLSKMKSSFKNIDIKYYLQLLLSAQIQQKSMPEQLDYLADYLQCSFQTMNQQQKLEQVNILSSVKSPLTQKACRRICSTLIPHFPTPNTLNSVRILASLHKIATIYSISFINNNVFDLYLTVIQRLNMVEARTRPLSLTYLKALKFIKEYKPPNIKIFELPNVGSFTFDFMINKAEYDVYFDILDESKLYKDSETQLPFYRSKRMLSTNLGIRSSVLKSVNKQFYWSMLYNFDSNSLS